MLEFSVLDAFIAGLSTAFFGSLVAGGAYLLRQYMALREHATTLQNRMERLRTWESIFDRMGSDWDEILKRSKENTGGDVPAE